MRGPGGRFAVCLLMMADDVKCECRWRGYVFCEQGRMGWASSGCFVLVRFEFYEKKG